MKTFVDYGGYAALNDDQLNRWKAASNWIWRGIFLVCGFFIVIIALFVDPGILTKRSSLDGAR